MFTPNFSIMGGTSGVSAPHPFDLDISEDVHIRLALGTSQQLSHGLIPLRLVFPFHVFTHKTLSQLLSERPYVDDQHSVSTQYGSACPQGAKVWRGRKGITTP